MPITVNQNEMVYVVQFEGAIDIACASELKKHLMEGLASGKDVQVDLERATDIDVTALQLLWAAKREAERSGVTVAVVGRVPDTVSFVAHDAGFENFPIPTVEK